MTLTISLSKLYSFDLSIDYINPIGSYLSDRRQYDYYFGVSFRTYSVFSGVSQGYNRGLLLFVCFINDVTIRSPKVLIFAEYISTLNACIELQYDLKALNE